MPSNAEWRFRHIAPDEKDVEPNHREQFAARGAAESLIRESIQNSLDAANKGQLVKVVYHIIEIDASVARRYLGGLWPHIDAVRKKLPELPGAIEGRVRCLVIEDFSTTGLEGEPEVRDERTSTDEKNHFFRFWHRVGQSSDERKRLGSRGVGKVVFQIASRIRTFFGLTLRANDPRPLLMGEAGLVIHKLDGDSQRCVWYGYYAQFDGADAGALPISSDAAVKEFERAFSLQRGASPGLSVVVPYFHDDISGEDLARSVIENYFGPIIAGRVEVHVKHGSFERQLKRETIEAAAASLTVWPSKGSMSKEQVVKVLKLSRWQHELLPERYVEIAPVEGAAAYKVTADRINAEQLRTAADDFANQKPVAFRIGIPVRRRPQDPFVVDHVKVVLERDEHLTRSNIPHLRSGLNITTLRDIGPRGVRGLVLVGGGSDQELLDELLQTSEGSAHVMWELRGDEYKKAVSNFQDAKKIIELCRGIAGDLVRLLSAPAGGRDRRSFARMFPDATAQEERSLPGHLGKAGKKAGDKLGPRNQAETHAPTPIGVVEGIVRTWRGPDNVLPVEGARVRLLRRDCEPRECLSDADGKFRFSDVVSGEYTLLGEHPEHGKAQRRISLGDDAGEFVDVVLRIGVEPSSFIRTELPDGFSIRRNLAYEGPLRPIRVKVSYAGWGALNKKFFDGDFDLNDDALSLSFAGVKEPDRASLVEKPNVLRFTPVTAEYYVEVRGFETQFALNVETRTVDDPPPRPEVDEGGDE